MGCSCGANKNRVYITTLDTIYSEAQEIFKQYNGDQNIDIDKIDVQSLKEFVNEKIKPLLDYLENNQSRIINVAEFISKRAKKTTNQIEHLLALLTLNQVLPEISKYKYDKNFIRQMTRGKGKKKRRNLRKYNISRMLNKHILSNLVKFEAYFIETINYMLDSQYQNKKFMFLYIIETITIYVKTINDCQDEAVNGLERHSIITKILQNPYMIQNQDDGIENWEKQASILKSQAGVQDLLSMNAFQELREKIIDFVWRIICLGSECEPRLFKQDERDNLELQKLEVKKESLNYIRIIAKKSFEISDYSFLIIKLIQLMENDNWKRVSQLLTDLFEIIYSEMKNIKEAEVVQGVMIESILQYLVYEGSGQSKTKYGGLGTENSSLSRRGGHLQNNMQLAGPLSPAGRKYTIELQNLLISRESFLTFFYIEKIIKSQQKGMEFPEYNDEEYQAGLAVINNLAQKNDKSSSRNIPQIIETFLLDMKKRVIFYQDNQHDSNSDQVYEVLIKVCEFFNDTLIISSKSNSKFF